MIQYRNIEISFSGKSVLKNSGIDLKAGKVTLIHGPSGSGKTALLYRLALVNTDCDILFEGKKINNTDLFRREKTAFVMQNNELIDYLSVEDNLREYAAIAGEDITAEKMRELLDMVNLHVPFEQRCSLLSLGERERLCIACALCKNPQLIILDEPTASLDQPNKLIIFDLLRKIASSGKYVVFSSHERAAHEYSDEVFRIEHKELIQEKISEEEKEIPSVQSGRRFDARKFIINHIACYREKNRMLLFLNACFIMMSVLFSSLIMTWYSYHLTETRRLLFETSSKYLYVTDGSNEGYLDRDTNPVSLSIGYPVFKVSVLSGGTIPVVPYYEETDYTDKIDTYLSQEEHGAYISFRAKALIEKNAHIQAQMQFTVLDDSGIQESDFQIRGILKQGVRAYELSDNEVYVAVWHEDYEKYTHSCVTGRICFYQTYAELEEARNDLLSMGYTVNDQSASFEHILDVTREEESFYHKIQFILLIVSAALLTGIHIYSVHRRIREITLLRINGVPSHIISRMLISEQMPVYLILPASGIILSGIMYLLDIMLFRSFMICFAVLCLIQILLQIVTAVYLSVYKMDSVFRD